MLINGMYGLGDNVYQRSIIRQIKERVYLRTSWPQIYSDLPNVNCVKPKTNLRTQRKNIKKQPNSLWVNPPALPFTKLSYSAGDLRRMSILKSLSKSIGVVPEVFDLPKFTGRMIDKRYAVIRPAVIRAEWYNMARGPKNEYIYEATRILKKKGFYTISVADLNGKEWCKMLPEADLKYNNGELCFEELMGLVQHADLVVGGVGWILPTCSAYSTPHISILGGQGGHNAPEKTIDSPMNESKIRLIKPDHYCMCTNMRHACRKEITNFEDKFSHALEELC